MSKKANIWQQYLEGLQTKLEDSNKDNTSETNEINRSLLNQLFIIAGGIITLMSPFVVTTDILKVLPYGIRCMLMLTILIAMLSLICGIAQFYIDRRFLTRLKKANTVVIKAIGEGTIEGPKHLKTLLSEQDKIGERSSDKWTWAQFATLIIAGVGFIWVMWYIVLVAKFK